MKPLFLLPALLMLACSAAPPPKPSKPVDCSAGDDYVFFGKTGLAYADTDQTIYNFEAGGVGWYIAADCNGGHWDPDADAGAGACIVNPDVASSNKGDLLTCSLNGASDVSPACRNKPTDMGEAGRCGSTRAAFMESYGHNDWGSYWATWDLEPANGTGSDGIAFWARNPDHTGHMQDVPNSNGITNKTVWFRVGDWRQVIAQNSTPSTLPPGDYRCTPGPATTSTAGYTDTGQVTTTTRVPGPNECGNYFKTPVTTTNDWQLYLLPWNTFFQEPYPNRNSDGIDLRDIRYFEFAVPIGSSVELWVDDIAFYRKRQAAPLNRE